ncbi:MAG: aminopeptidase N [Bdellovibrionota bacterium]
MSEGYASYRSAHVSQVDYILELAFTKEGKTFAGKNQITFNLDAPIQNLSLDYNDGVIRSLILNGKELQPQFNGYYIDLPIEQLQTGKNQVTIEYVGNYATDGSGLYYFKDPEDGRQYLYSNFEPYDANQLFPCFDQPDLKASYTLTVDAPKQWTVISADRETAIKAKNTTTQTWTFPQSKRFSTYIFPLHLGDYKEIAIKDYQNIELRLFARHALAKYVKAKDWESATLHGFQFFQTYFDFPYPFSKYDQILVPDFNAGAMENVGAVTFAENRVSRGEKTQRDRFRLSNTILHEMAHMWFGNLVTMKWWNDLWLNESFATFAAYIANSTNPDFPDTWKQFTDIKQWAYDTDAQVTTHPIEAHMPSSDDAFANFDGITYGKGAASLQQLFYLIGEDAFRDGMRTYFKKHAWSNTVRTDFTNALATQTDLDLNTWSKQWLQTAGTNTLASNYTCKEGKIDTFIIEQSAPEDSTQLRMHRNEGALLDTSFNVYKTAPQLIKGKTTRVSTFEGQPCPALVLLNANDKDFVRVALDEKSIAFLHDNISSIPSETLRANLWATLWDMTKKNKLGITAYTDMVDSHLPQEKDIVVARAIVTTLTGDVQSVDFLLPHNTAQEKKIMTMSSKTSTKNCIAYLHPLKLVLISKSSGLAGLWQPAQHQPT